MKVERREMQCHRDLTQPQPQNFVKGVRFFHTCIFWAGNLNTRPLFMRSCPPISFVFPVSSCHLISLVHLKIQKIRNIFNFWKMGGFFWETLQLAFLNDLVNSLLAKLEQIREKIQAKQNPQEFFGYHNYVLVQIYINMVKKLWKDSQMRKAVHLVSCHHEVSETFLGPCCWPRSGSRP